MTLKDVVETCFAIVASLGGGGAIVLGLSKFIGKTWAERTLEKQRQEYTKLNLEFTNQLDLATRQLQIELDAIGHLRKLRTADEFEKLRGLWRMVADLRVAFYSLPRAGLRVESADPKKRKEQHIKASEEFARLLYDAQHTLNQETLSIPKNVADAANQLLKIAHDEYLQVLFHPDPDEFSPTNPLPQDFFSQRSKRLAQFDTDASALETTLRTHLQTSSEKAV